jgi:hypothetical protein
LPAGKAVQHIPITIHAISPYCLVLNRDGHVCKIPVGSGRDTIQDMWAGATVVAVKRCVIEVIFLVVHDIEEIPVAINVVGTERPSVYAPVIEYLIVPAEAGDILFRYRESLTVALSYKVNLTRVPLFLKDCKQIATQVADVEGFHPCDSLLRLVTIFYFIDILSTAGSGAKGRGAFHAIKGCPGIMRGYKQRLSFPDGHVSQTPRLLFPINRILTGEEYQK